nr:hypothetical protein [Nanoarchaeota archaeon]
MAESKYKKYDGRFWNKQLRQIRYDEKEDSKTVMKFLNPILNIITFGNLGNIRRRRKIKIKIKKDDLAKPQEIFLDDELPPILYKQEKDGDFIINGVNDRNTIESLTSLTGLSTSELEKRMWPDDREFSELKRGEYHGSNSGFGGFIKPGESLLEIMARDNDLVLDMGYTHQQVAKPMFQILNAYILADYHRLSNIYFTLN